MSQSDIREAASVILMRERASDPAAGLEVFLLRRHNKAGFMARSFVFPGGISDQRDARDPRLTAARELFEEAGVLLAHPPVLAEVAAEWRPRVDEGEACLVDLLRKAGGSVLVNELHYFAHWITPSIEKRRYSARFFVAKLPLGQTASADLRETVEEVWVTPDEALERSAELRLPPPQVRSFLDLRDAARAGWDAVVELCRKRADAPHPILPRMAPEKDGGFSLLLPWDPDYERVGTGDAHAMPVDHPLATGPSRFVLGKTGWQNVPASPRP